jgi:hypothetical protein
MSIAPGGHGTTIWTGRVGKSCAGAALSASTMVMSPVSNAGTACIRPPRNLDCRHSSCK